MKKIILTGDRPTGSLHIGHYVGSLKSRVELQNSGEYEQFVMIADLQALTDNAENPAKIRENLMEVMLDYLAVGLEPDKTHFFIQSQVPALFELPMYYANLVTMARLERNPTVKSEIKERERILPVGFITYPISQAADITAFSATHVPVGSDQLPMIEQTREIVESFNRIYGEILTLPEAVIPKSANARRLVGIDGNAKMSKSLGNCIYLKDTPELIKSKIMKMYTDPNHIKVEDPGQVEGNVVFTYLDIFAKEEHFKKYLPKYQNLEELKAHYQRGGLGDITIKNFLNEVMQELLKPMRERREYFEQRKPEVLEMLKKGSQLAKERSDKLVLEVRKAMGLNYFEDELFIKSYINNV